MLTVAPVTSNLTTRTQSSREAVRPSESKLETAELDTGDSVAISEFARGRHKPNSGLSYYDGPMDDILTLVKQNWNKRLPGTGRKNLKEVVVVPVPPTGFFTTTVPVDDETSLKANFGRRRPHEEPYLSVMSEGEAIPASFAKVVLYSHETLAENNEQSANTDWELVSLIASPVEDEPMSPVTMMRNMKGKPGGSQVSYSAEELVNAIEFWSKHTKVKPKRVGT
jgi:uncharacterized protein DUF3228